MKNNIFSFFEQTVEKLKDLIEGSSNDVQKHIDVEDLKQLKKEINGLVDTLNKFYDREKNIIDKIQTEKSFAESIDVKRLFFSDLIQLYNKFNGNHTIKSDFVLAYYYDVLLHDHYAQEENLNALNELIETEDFKKHIIQIVEKNNLSRMDKKLILSSNKDISEESKNHILIRYESFLNLAFSLKFKTDKDKAEFFDINPKGEKNETLQNETLEDVLKELQELIGLENVKNDVSQLINLLKVQKQRSTKGLKNADFSLHTVFLGPPGTGKTSVARLLGKIFKHLGFLSKGQVIETDREGMVAGFVGQTATKVNELVEQSLGGVLFIDEAYALTQHVGTSDYGSEAVNTLLKRMEDNRKDFAVIVAGYTEPMKEFIESNPGLRSRFSRHFYFDHFLPEELNDIFELFCKKTDFILSTGAKEKIQDIFGLMYDKKTDSFGNARVARNLFEKCIQNHANRVVSLKRLTQKALKTIEEEDVPEPIDALKMFMEEKELN